MNRFLAIRQHLRQSKGIYLFVIAILLAIQLTWLLNHQFAHAAYRLGLAILVGSIIGTLACAIAAYPWGQAQGYARIQRLSRFLLPWTVVAALPFVDPHFPIITLVVAGLLLIYQIDRLGVARDVVGLACRSSNTRIWGVAAIFAAAVVVIATRDVNLLLHPRFWAEDGAHAFVFAWHHDWISVLLRTSHYYFFYENLASLLSERLVSLENAPLVMTICAFAIQLLPIGIVLLGQSSLFDSPLKKLLAVAVILFVPDSSETWLNANGSQYYLASATALILCESDLDSSVLRCWIYRLFLVIAGLSGVLSAAMAPLFMVRYLRERQREIGIQAMVLVACIFVQAYVVLIEAGLANRTSSASMVTLGHILFSKHVVLPFYTLLAEDYSRYLVRLLLIKNFDYYNTIGLVSLIMMVVFIAFMTYRLRRSAALYTLWAFVILTLLAAFYGIGDTNNQVFILVNAGSRYFHVPNILLVLSLMAAACARPMIARRVPGPAIAITIAALVLVNGAHFFYQTPVSEPGWPIWREQVAEWRKDPNRSLEIWPPPWKFGLSPEKRAANRGN